MLAFLRSLFQRFWKAPASAKASSEVASSDLAQESAPAAVLVPYDENLLERARTQWQFGDWESLAKIDRETIQHHPDRAKLALLAAAGRLQTGGDNEAKVFIRLAQDWGVSKALLVRILAAGVHNSLGRAAVIAGNRDRALQHFYGAITTGMPGSEVRLLAQARFSQQYQKVILESKRPYNIAIKEDRFCSATEEENIEELIDKNNPFYEGITSYSQNFEDVMLWRALHRIDKGFYIDIGAGHPINDSVSKSFYEKGWRGIHIEPLPNLAELLRKDRPDELVIQAIVTDSKNLKTSKFYEIPDAQGLSTGLMDIAIKHKNKGYRYVEHIFPCITLEDIFEYTGGRDIHWMKIDVEGMEFNVLNSWGNNSYRPWIVVVESTLPNTQIETYHQWEHLLTSKDYKMVYFDGVNRFYIYYKYCHLASAFRWGPNAFDNFTLSGRGGPYCWKLNETIEKQNQIINELMASRR